MKLYIEYDPQEDIWDIMQEEGGHEHGQYYDTLLFSTPTKEDAEDAVKLIMGLITGGYT